MRTNPANRNSEAHPSNRIPSKLIALLLLLSITGELTYATIPDPSAPPPWLDFWTFNDTNYWITAKGYPAATFTNITPSELGDYSAAVVDDTNGPAWLNYNITEADGTNHLRVDRGSIMFWFAPNWSGTNQGGTGPGEWSRLLEVGAYTTNASYGWWSLYTDPEGVNLFFSAQTNDGSGATYLSAPIAWNVTNRWHLIALTYSGTNSALWIDAVLITNGLPVTYWPGPDVLTNGFFIGSDGGGLFQAHGMFDNLVTYGYEIDGATITKTYWGEAIYYYGNPMNLANMAASAPSSPIFTPAFNAVTGLGNLVPVSTNSIGCVTNSQVWLTNVVATMATNNTMNLTFTIAGGANSTLYDVFAHSVLTFSTNTAPWSWIGQGYHCTTYLATNLPPEGAFMVLGKQLDSDSDGLTDAYEGLVSKTNPLLWDTDGDGKGDGWEVMLETDPLNYDAASPLEMPAVGSSYLRILAPDLLEMVRITSDTNEWNFTTTVVTTNGTNIVIDIVAAPPATIQFQVKSGGASINVTQVGFKRRPLYAPLTQYDLRIENTLYLRLASTNWATSNATVEVTTTNSALWPTTMRFVSVNKPLRYSPAIHVNQEGYLPTYQKKGMIGYYLGSLGEMQISTNLGFKLVDAASGGQVYPAIGLATLTASPDDFASWGTAGVNPIPQYQFVLEADFSSLASSGQYQLVVPGIGASYSFRIHEGTTMKLARTFALGLYHQRCGVGPDGLLVNDLQFTRFPHTNCHAAPASVPLPMSSYSSTWNFLSGYGNETYTKNKENPPQIAPALVDASTMRFPFPTNLTSVDVSGGHHDAGDYSKYTINSAHLLHILTFAADNLGLTNFDNFGLPESSDGIPDILQAAKWEADFLLKMQDTNDGGFYFLVYPKDSEYEDELPGNHPQVIWPKTTAVTADAVAALAEIGSSPAFSRIPVFQAFTNRYMQAAIKGWDFLSNAIAQYGMDGCYQRITHYGDEFTHDDELAWAAASLYAATGNSVYSNKLHKWFPNPAEGHNGYTFKRYDSTNNFPAASNLFVAVAYLPNTNDLGNTANTMWFTIWDAEGQKVVTNRIETAIPHITDPDISKRLYELKTNLNAHPNDLNSNDALDRVSSLVGFCHKTWRFGWWRMWEGYGSACRAYAFAARSGRLSTNALHPAYLQKCHSEITNRAAELRLWSSQNAYGTSCDPYTKNRYEASWYFGDDRAFDLAVADRIQPDVGNTNALIENLDYEAGRNPINVSRITGLGWYRQREIVHQYSQNNPSAVLPPSGIPLGNIASTLYFTSLYGELDPLCFPSNKRGSNFFALYDRWAEVFNVTTEFVHLQTARGLVSAGYVANSPAMRTQVWQRADASIIFPNGIPFLNTKCVAQLSTTQDLAGAQIVWDPGRASWSTLDQDPAFATNLAFFPMTVGDNRSLQVEAVLPDGRRIFAVTNNLSIWDPVNGGTNFANDANTVALYHFDDTNNSFADSSGHVYTLTPNTNVSRGVSLTNNANWMKSPTGYAARFLGAGNYLDVQIPTNNLPLRTNSSVTIEARIYPRHYQADGKDILKLSQVFNSGNPPTATQWALYYDANQSLDAPGIYANCCEMLNGSQLKSALTPNTWHQLKITFTGGTTSTCVDGILLGISTNPPIYALSTAWTLTLGNFDGDIDEVRISNIVR